MNGMPSVLLAQLHLKCSDIAANTNLIIQTIEQNLGRDIIVFPELAVTGYLPRDLLFNKEYLHQVDCSIAKVLGACKSYAGLVLLPSPVVVDIDGKSILINACLWIVNGQIVKITQKICLPHENVFAEYRYFNVSSKAEQFSVLSDLVCRDFNAMRCGADNFVYSYNGKQIACLICHDLWGDGAFDLLSANIERLDDIIVMNASPYEIDKLDKRVELCRKWSKRFDCNVYYCNQVGAMDGVLFDGRSFVVEEEGMVSVSNSFRLSVQSVDYQHYVPFDSEYDVIFGVAKERSLVVIKDALVFGLREYYAKNLFDGVLIGISGGIDSALVACLACEALGTDKVKGVFMPTMFNTDQTYRDAVELCGSLGISLEVISIQDSFDCVANTLSHTSNAPNSIAMQNLQARLRGVILMSISNSKNLLLLTTGNKSEMATGYATLYGDMCGGINIVKDLYKTLLYKICGLYPKIPQNIITKAPSAELDHGQKDSDTLPDYDILDKILYFYIECDMSCDDIALRGFEVSIVEHVIGLVNKAEYKRKQACFGIKVSSKDFTYDRILNIS